MVALLQPFLIHGLMRKIVMLIDIECACLAQTLFML